MKTPKWFLTKNLISILLLPLSFIYLIISNIVFIVRKTKIKKFNTKIICIGNLLSGGVGKTPIVKEIACHFNAPVIMRGYKQTHKNISDEALLFMKYGLRVHTGNRKSSLKLLNNEKIAVMDDGFQNSSIYKDISIIVFDSNIKFGNGFLLPSGPLRETKKGLKRADAIIVIKNNNDNNFTINVNKPVFYAKSNTINPYKKNEKIIVFSGIGYPKKFFKTVPNIHSKSFPDHYQYKEKDIIKLIKLADKKKAKLLTTEKDWVRLPDKYKEKIKFASLEIKIEKNFWNWIEEKVNNDNF